MPRSAGVIDEETARQRLVEAADRLFYARGVQAVGMDAVRSEAGVSLKRIYALFPSKDDLVTAVLGRRSALWADGIEAALATADDPAEKLLAIFDYLDDWFHEPDFRGCAFINLYGELGPSSPNAAEAVRRQKRGFATLVAGLVAEAGLPDDLAPQLVVLVEGAQTTAAILGDPEVARQAKAAAVVLIEEARRSGE
ncbi:TetR/AcrR family transcriptional regulator [Microlunatus parietis]|uniref:AcrR family transcriptional regulator n=1 Tax=Microlunatus parietis TaxID=682979 RepID=A0A7Y9I7E6_9ACTN|nr:TetR/AcrR family transcriptional regulator [Microlunatus parietis]NYE71440.1 AcrR family transcriptional regulator [Microlunatus parietis]